CLMYLDVRLKPGFFFLGGGGGGGWGCITNPHKGRRKFQACTVLYATTLGIEQLFWLMQQSELNTVITRIMEFVPNFNLNAINTEVQNIISSLLVNFHRMGFWLKKADKYIVADNYTSNTAAGGIVAG
ncbi:hypothetical protein ACJX0J_009547, partial [Zea mays]